MTRRGDYYTDVPDNAFQSVLMDDVERLVEAPGVALWNVVAVPLRLSCSTLSVLRIRITTRRSISAA